MGWWEDQIAQLEVAADGNTGITGGMTGGLATNFGKQPSMDGNRQTADPSTLLQPRENYPLPTNITPGAGQQPVNGGIMGGQPGGLGTTSGQDPKTAIQAILAKYPPGSAGLQQAMPEIQAAFPGTRFDSSGGPKDEIVIPGYGLVDVVTNAETGGTQGWSWQTSGGQPQAGGQPLGQIAGGDVFTHQLIDPFFKEELFRQHPSLKDAPAWEGPKESDYSNDQEYRKAVTDYIASYLKKAEAQFGSELPIKQAR